MDNNIYFKKHDIKNVYADERFSSFYKNRLRQVFFYVTENCNARCSYCYYKPLLKESHNAHEVDMSVFFSLIKYFKKLGANKLSLLGGEPTLYGSNGKSAGGIADLIVAAKSIGYEYVRMVTNGLFDLLLLNDSGIKQLDEITFSLDGYTADINDRERGFGNFIKTEKSIMKAVDAGFKVQITVCIHRYNFDHNDFGEFFVDKMIKWAHKVGALSINFHPIFKMNIPRDEWAGMLGILPFEWKFIYERTFRNILSGNYPINVRLPLRFIDADTFLKKSDYYGYCPLKLGERVILHASGNINACALNNATNISLAKYGIDDGMLRVRWCKSNNELSSHEFDFENNHPCTIVNSNNNNELPLCISLKPLQNEFIWNGMNMDSLECANVNGNI